MTAFEQAWGIAKQYTPNWREDAKRKGLLSGDPSTYLALLPYEQNFFVNTDGEIIDGDEARESPNRYPYFLGDGTKVATFKHPSSNDYVMKLPYSTDWSQGMYDLRSAGDLSIQALEAMGYPIVGEIGTDHLGLGENFRVQPRLTAASGNMFAPVANQMDELSAILQAIVGDRQISNFGIDSQGLPRMFDLDQFGTHIRLPDDMEGHQEVLNSFGIQHPATRILNTIEAPYVSNRPNFRSFIDYMEALEPYSDNPNELTIYGKPKWLEGYS